ncbi:hypothetical protein OTU49_016398, partial [Cherax quadricarinatus]
INMRQQLQCLGLLALIYLVICHDTANMNEDDLSYSLDQLYKEPEDTVDPHDMLAFPGQKRVPTAHESGPWTHEDKKAEVVTGNEESHTSNELSTCQERVSKLEHGIEVEQQKLSALRKKLNNEGSIDMEAFYSRSIRHLWNVLLLEEAGYILKDENSAVIRHLIVRVTKDDIDMLKQYLEHQKYIHQVDDFLQRAFTLDNPPVDEKFNFINSFMALTVSLLEIGKNLETWLYLLCIGFLILAFWAIYLFVQDIQQELRWGRVLTMMMIVVFFICCVWHWRHLHMVAESRRHAQMMKRGFNNMPEECKPGGHGDTRSLLDWLKINLFGSPDVCERYFEELMVDPTQEITPAMAIAETLAKFFLQPLQHLGSESAKLITNFYNNVPLVYHVPATILFVALLVIILFYIRGYGMDFPLWMGGIRPVYRNEVTDTSEVDRITRQAIAQLNRDRERFMEESRSILTDITKAVVSTQNQVDIRPLLSSSSSIIENELERLVARKLASIFPQGSITDTNALQLDRNHRTTQHESDVLMVTSTPARKETSYEDNREEQTSFEERQNKIKLELKGLGVVTDAVHYRLTNSRREKVLPPKNGRSGSNSGSRVSNENSRTVSVLKASGRQLEQSPSSGHIQSKINTSSSSLQGLNNTPSSNQGKLMDNVIEKNLSLEFDEPDNDNTDPSTSDDFVFQIRSFLENSANSSLNDSNALLDNSNSVSVRQRHNQNENISLQNSQEKYHEVELSEPSVQFLKTIESVLTPEA